MKYQTPNRKSFEPFRAIGTDSNIWNKEEAKLISTKASYYIFSAGLILLVLAVIQYFFINYTFYSGVILILGGLVFLTCSYFIYKKSSKVAAYIVLGVIVIFILERVYYDAFIVQGYGMVVVLLLVVAVRATQATTAFHNYANKAVK